MMHNGQQLTLTREQTVPVYDEDSLGREPTLAPETPPAPEPQLSRARAGLLAAQERLAAAHRAHAAAVENFNKVEKLVPSTAPIADRILELGKQHAELIEAWALAGGAGDVPPNPHTAEIQSLQDDLRTAQQQAAGASAALVKLREGLRVHQSDVQACITAVRDARDAVLVEDAEAAAAELAAADRRQAWLRGHLIGLQRHFHLHGGRFAGRVDGLFDPRGGLVPTDNVVNSAAQKWERFADCLFADPAAELHELKEC
jgi:hypothetical protein